MNPLPPQAYTKDTLTKAYLWLLNQNESIKELATTPDTLVTLYLKAQRNGDDSLDTPSIQNFKNELKSLAGLMGELEGKPAAEKLSGPGTQPNPANHGAPSNRGATAGQSVPSPQGSATLSQAAPAPNFPPSSAAGPAPSASAGPAPSASAGFGFSTSPFLGASSMNFQGAPPNSQPYPQPHSAPPSAPPSAQPSAPRRPGPAANSSLPPEIIGQLDLKSQAMVAEVREELNLGSDVEVLRLLISLGYKKARNLYS
jgi:hypothetical protein